VSFAMRDDVPVTYDHSKRIIKTEKGREVPADITYFCSGLTLNNHALGRFRVPELMEKGRLKVDDKLRVVGFKNVWAIGDISNREADMGYLAHKQAEYVAEYFTKVIHGKATAFPDYINAAPASVVSIGRNHGVAQIMGHVYGSRLSKFVKSKEMFVPANWNDLNMDRKTRKPVKHSDGRFQSLALAMNLTPEQAEWIKTGNLPAYDLDAHERKETVLKRQEATETAGLGVSLQIEDTLSDTRVFAVLKEKITTPQLFSPVSNVTTRVSDDGLGVYREMTKEEDRLKENIYTNEAKKELVFKLVGEETEHVNALVVDAKTGLRYLEFYARDGKTMNRIPWEAPRPMVLGGVQKVLEKARLSG